MFLPNRPVQPVKAQAYKKGGIVQGGKALLTPTEGHLSQTMHGDTVVHVPKVMDKPAVFSGLLATKKVKASKSAPKAKKSKAKPKKK